MFFGLKIFKGIAPLKVLKMGNIHIFLISNAPGPEFREHKKWEGEVWGHDRARDGWLSIGAVTWRVSQSISFITIIRFGSVTADDFFYTFHFRKLIIGLQFRKYILSPELVLTKLDSPWVSLCPQTPPFTPRQTAGDCFYNLTITKSSDIPHLHSLLTLMLNWS